MEIHPMGGDFEASRSNYAQFIESNNSREKVRLITI